MTHFDFSPQAVAALAHADVARALAEDVGSGDLTAALIDPKRRARARILVREAAVLCGSAWASAAVLALDPSAVLTWHVKEGERTVAGQVVLDIEGQAQALLTAERTALNLLCHLSGIATATASWVDAVEGTGAIIRDTRKTTPGLRALEKYAVRCGGGQNHRMSLSDAALVKDNHIVAAGGVAEAFAKVRALADSLPIEIEVDTLEQLQVALDAGANVVLLDNMPPAVMKEAVAISQQHSASTGHAVLLEASGGLTIGTARAVAETGVHFISVGGLTHSSPILDVGLDLQTIV